MIFGIWLLASYITDPAGISQTNDAVFHLNAIRFAMDTANASSLTINEVIGGSSFYPAAWHALASLIVMATGASVPVGVNMLTIVIGALIWPLGLAWLTRLVVRSDLVAAWAAILSGALHTFPLLMFQWGVLFPNALSIALIPAALGIVVSLAGWSDASATVRGILRGALLILVAVAALALAQPAALLPWALLLSFWVSGILSARGGRLPMWGRVGLISALWAVLVTAWVLLSRGTSGSHWPPFRGKVQAALEIFLNGQLGIPFAPVMSALMIWGLVTACRRSGLRWLVFSWLAFSALYGLVAAVATPWVRTSILGAWYADPYRIAALAPLVVIPLAAVGFADLAARLGRALARRRGAPGESARISATVGIVVLSLFMLAIAVIRPVAMPAFLEGTFDRDSRYLSVDDSYLSSDERKLLDKLDQVVPAGERVLGNPSTGTGFGYMISGVDVYPRTWSSPRTDAWATIGARLRDAAADPAVCAALHEYGDPRYVLDFGPGEKSPGRYELPGMTDFDGKPGFEKVTGVGDVSLWRITACAR